MSQLQSEIRITNAAFIRRINDYQTVTGEKASTKVVERLAAERLAQLELTQASSRASAAGTDEGGKNKAELTPTSAEANYKRNS